MLVRYSKPFGIDLFDALFNDEIFNTTNVEYDITEDDEKFGLEFMLPGFKKEDM